MDVMTFDFEKTFLEIEQKINDLRQGDKATSPEVQAQITQLEKECAQEKKRVYSNLTPWQTVQIARHPGRPLIRDFVAGVFSEFLELHGDRCFGDDQAIIGGFARIEKFRVMLIGHQKGRNTEENIARNFGMARPEGYRKALRLMHLAEKYRIPIITFVDTPGAYPGADAEERGQAEAIARNLTEMSSLESPIITVVTGEGGSGGAIGIGVSDILLMLSNSIYSVISPEGCASILWRDDTKAPEAAAALKITSASLLKLGIIDGVIQEPLGGAHRNYGETMQSVKEALVSNLKHLKRYSARKLVSKRFEKYSRIGKYR